MSDDPSTIGSAANGPPPPAELGDELSDYQRGAGRQVQVTRRGRSRFDAAKRRRFLEWFAATANAKESARRAGVAYSTVYRTRMLNARFAEGWDRALEQGYARVEAKLLEMQFEEAVGAPIDFDGGFEPDAPDPRLTDPVMAMQLLKQHRGEVMKIRAGLRSGETEANPRARGRRKAQPPSERGLLASDAEVRRALAKSLQAYGVRVTKGDLKGEKDPHPSPLPHAGEGEDSSVIASAAKQSSVDRHGSGEPRDDDPE